MMLSYRLIASLVLALGLLAAALAGCDTANPPPDELRRERTGSPERPVPKSEEEIPDSLDVVSGPDVERTFPVDAIVDPPPSGGGSLAYDSIGSVMGRGEARLDGRTLLVYTSPEDLGEGQKEPKTPVRGTPAPKPPPSKGEPPTRGRKVDPPSSPEELDRGQGLEGRTDIDEVQSRQPTAEGGPVRSQELSRGFQPDTVTVPYKVTYGDAMNTGTLAVILKENEPPRIDTNEGVKVGEGETTTITTSELSASDPDPDDTPRDLTFIIQTTPENGEIRVGGTVVNEFTQRDILSGVVTYAHEGAIEPEDRFSFQVRDPQGVTQGQGSQFFEINVNLDENQRPIAEDDSYEIDEDNSLQASAPGVLANDDDPDGNNDSLTVARVQGSPDNVGTELVLNSGSVARVSGNGEFFYNPNDQFERLGPDEMGSDSLTYVAEDRRGGRDTAMVRMTITGANDAPNATNDSTSVDEGGSDTIDVVANDTDPEGQSLSVSNVTSPSHGTATSNGDGTITYTHDGSETSSDSFTYTVSDGSGGTDQATVSITVNAVNDAPNASADSASVNEGGSATIDVVANDTDPDGDNLSVTNVGSPSSGTATNNNDGTVTYTHDGSETSSDSFTYTVSDGNGGTDQATVSISVNNDPNASADSASVNEGDTTTIDVVANDTDPEGQSLSVSNVSSPSNGTATSNGDGTITYAHDGSETSSDSFTYTVSDGSGGTDQATVSISVNNDPNASADSASVNEGDTTTIDVVANDTDPEGQSLSVSNVSSPSNGTATNNNDGTVTYTHDGSETSSDSFTYTVSDGSGGTDQATVSISVNNDPNASADSASVNEGDTTTIDVVANDTDPEGQSLSVSNVSSPSNGTATNNNDGTVTYAHDGSETSSDSFTYTVSDGGGGTDQATVSISVNNDPNASADSASVNEGEATTIDVVANDTDPEGQSLSVTNVTSPSNGTATSNGDGTITYAHDGSETSSDSFTYTVSDGGGGTDQATVSIDVNLRPVADDDSDQTPEQEFTTTDVLVNDSDPDGDGLDASTVTVQEDPNQGSVTINDDGSITYAPDAVTQSSFEDTYTYTVEDSAGAESNEATVTITIDEAPVAQDDSDQTTEGQSTTTDVFANDFDREGSIRPPTVEVQSSPSNGQITGSGPTGVTYEPDPGFTGTDSYTYTVEDDVGNESNEATVTIDVQPSN